MNELSQVDPQRRCPKCGGDASLKHMSAFEISIAFLILVNECSYPAGVIVRRCQRCHHGWYETPLDHVEQTPDQLRECRERKRLANEERAKA